HYVTILASRTLGPELPEPPPRFPLGGRILPDFGGYGRPREHGSACRAQASRRRAQYARGPRDRSALRGTGVGPPRDHDRPGGRGGAPRRSGTFGAAG